MKKVFHGIEIMKFWTVQFAVVQQVPFYQFVVLVVCKSSSV